MWPFTSCWKKKKIKQLCRRKSFTVKIFYSNLISMHLPLVSSVHLMIPYPRILLVFTLKSHDILIYVKENIIIYYGSSYWDQIVNMKRNRKAMGKNHITYYILLLTSFINRPFAQKFFHWSEKKESSEMADDLVPQAIRCLYFSVRKTL